MAETIPPRMVTHRRDVINGLPKMPCGPDPSLSHFNTLNFVVPAEFKSTKAVGFCHNKDS